MTPTRYRATESTEFVVAGEIVYLFLGYDYGLAKDDTRVFRREHVSVTKQPDGRGFSFTHPRESLKPIYRVPSGRKNLGYLLVTTPTGCDMDSTWKKNEH